MTYAKNFDAKKAFGTDPVEGYDLFRDTWFNHGWNVGLQEQITLGDALNTSQAQEWMPKIVEELSWEPIEPILVIPSLFDEIPYQGFKEYRMTSVSALEAEVVAESQAYPEVSVNIIPGTVTTSIDKFGLALSFSEEMKRDTTFDFVNLHVRQMFRALARKKEKIGFDTMLGMGTTTFDNLNPDTSIFGTCTGRDASGSGNGACTMDDLLKTYAFMTMAGFLPNLLIMHPFTWSIWLQDPWLQTIAMNTANGQFFQPHELAKPQTQWSGSKTSRSGKELVIPGNAANGESATALKNVNPTFASKPQIPGYFPHPLTVIVTPLAPFDPDKELCDIIMIDQRALGAMIIDERPGMSQWTDLSTDVHKLKIRERYGFMIYEDGLGVCLMKNIPIVPNRINPGAIQPTISAAGSLDELDTTTAISGL